MMIFQPPPPTIIGSGAGGSDGSSLNTSDASIILNTNPNTGSSNVVFTTNNSQAMAINESQNVLIGDIDTELSQRLVIASPDGNALALVYDSTLMQALFNISAGGALSIRTSGNTIDLNNNVLYLGNNSLNLNGMVVNATANQLNYLTVSPGFGAPSKALTLNSNSSVSGINSLSATTVTGTLQTAYQPNINRVTNLNIDNSLTIAERPVLATADELNYVQVMAGAASNNKALILDSQGSIVGINALSATQLTGTLQTANQPNIASVGTLSNLNTTGFLGVGTDTPSADIEIYNVANPMLKLNNGTVSSNITIDSSGNLFLNSDGNVFIGANRSLQLNGTGQITGADRISANYLDGLITTAAQTNITSLGVLNNLNVSGLVGVGTTNPNKKMEVVSADGNCFRLTRNSNYYTDFLVAANGDLSILTVGNIILGADTSIRFASGTITGLSAITSTNITGTLTTGNQSNITSIGTLSALTVTNGISAGSLTTTTITGTLQTPSQPNITTIGTLGSLVVTGGISAESLSTGNIVGTLLTTSQSNITTIGTLGTLAVTNGITAGSLTATTITGTLATANQPNITSIGIQSNLMVTNTLSANTVTAVNLNGVLQTVAQPNITSLGTLSVLAVNETITATSVTATNLNGTIQTAAQPNITSLGTLSSLLITNGISAATITGTLVTSAQPNITSVGTLNHVYTSGRIGIGTISPEFDIDVNSNGGQLLQGSYNNKFISFTMNSSGDCTLNTNSNSNNFILANGTGLAFSGGGTINGLNILTANTIVGTLQTVSQPNITSLGTLTSLNARTILIGADHTSAYDVSVVSTTGQLLSLSANGTTITHRIVSNNYVISSTSGSVNLDTNMNLVLSGGTIIGLTTITATNLSGTLQTVAQPNITSVGTLTSLTISGALTIGSTSISETEIGTLNGITAGTALASKALVLDSSANITGINSLSTTTLIVNGTDISTIISEGASPYVTDITPGTATASKALVLDSSSNISGINSLSATNLNISGLVGVGTASTSTSQLEVNSITGDCLKLSYDSVTSASNYASLTVSSGGNLTIAASGGITTIAQIASTQITLGNSSNNSMPLEVGYVPFVMTGAYAYNTNTNSHGTIASGGTTSYNYSIRALGRILCTQSVDVTSDRRLKYNIQNLEDDYCTKFITDTTPVSFNWINGDSFTSYGYIAQDLLRNGFDDLVNLADDKNMNQEVDSDGLISPQGIKFTISYQHIIPILAQNQKRLMQENKALSDKVDKLMDLINQLTTQKL